MLYFHDHEIQSRNPVYQLNEEEACIFCTYPPACSEIEVTVLISSRAGVLNARNEMTTCVMLGEPDYTLIKLVEAHVKQANRRWRERASVEELEI